MAYLKRSSATITKRTSDSPILTTPALGTPSAGVMTNMTGAVEASLVDDAVTLAKMAGGTDGEVISYDASGNPVAIGVGSDGQALTSTGAGSPPAFEDVGGGIENASLWRVTSDYTGAQANVDPIVNWETNDTYGPGILGSVMSESSGIFTFPSTGMWLVTFHVNFFWTSSFRYNGFMIKNTTDNSTYNENSMAENWIRSTYGENYMSSCSCRSLLDITATGTHKVKFMQYVQGSDAVVNRGSSSRNDQYATFIRLGDT